MKLILTDPESMSTILMFSQTNGQPISEIYAERPDETVELITAATADFVRLINPRYEAQPAQLSYLFNLLVNNYPRLTTKAYALFLNNLALGKYGGFYGDFDLIRFFESISKFYDEFVAYWDKRPRTVPKLSDNPLKYYSISRVNNLRQLAKMSEKECRRWLCSGRPFGFYLETCYYLTENEYLEYIYPDPADRPPTGLTYDEFLKLNDENPNQYGKFQGKSFDRFYGDGQDTITEYEQKVYDQTTFALVDEYSKQIAIEIMEQLNLPMPDEKI